MTALLSIQKRLKKVRLLRGYTQKKLATILDKSTSVIRDYENGQTSPQLEVVAKIADALSVNIEWVLLGQTVQSVRKDVKDKLVVLKEQSIKVDKEITEIEEQQNELRTKKKKLNKKLKLIDEEIKILGGWYVYNYS